MDRTPLDAIRPPSNPDPNSRAAAASMDVPAVAQREAVLALIRDHQPVATWRLEELTGGRHQSISARVYELHREGYIVRVGRNKTPSGRSAHTYAIGSYAVPGGPGEPTERPTPDALRATADQIASQSPVPRDVPCPKPAAIFIEGRNKSRPDPSRRCGATVFLLSQSALDPTFWDARCPVHGKVTVRVTP